MASIDRNLIRIALRLLKIQAKVGHLLKALWNAGSRS